MAKKDPHLDDDIGEGTNPSPNPAPNYTPKPKKADNYVVPIIAAIVVLLLVIFA